MRTLTSLLAAACRHNPRAARLFSIARAGGATYVALYLLRRGYQSVRRRVQRIPALNQRTMENIDLTIGRRIESIEESLLHIERSRSIWAPWTVAAKRFTTDDNRQWWNRHDWSKRGEEWTTNVVWKSAIVEKYLIPFVPEGATVLEIGPGGGRWTEILRSRASRVYALDIAETPLRLCKERFQNDSMILCMLGDGRTIPVRSNCLDAVWSYDVFVHINPSDAQLYFSEFARALRAGAHAVIHHPGSGSTTERARQHRSDLTDEMVRRLAPMNGLDVVLQTTEGVNEGDVLTVMKRSSRRTT